MIAIAVTVISFSIVLVSYWAVARRDNSFINFMLPSLLTFLPANYLLQWGYMLLYGQDASNFAYTYCYLTYAAMFSAAAWGYCKGPIVKVSFQGSCANIGSKAWALMGAAWALYMPVLYEFRDYISNPREIYTRTRTGYGVSFFGSALLLNVAFICYLFQSKKSRVMAGAFVLSALGLAYLHGSKGQLVTYPLEWLIFLVYVRKERVGLLKTAGFALLFASLLGSMFFIFASESSKADLAVSLIEYSDYTRNAMMVIDDHGARPAWGRLTFEDNVYSRMPRVLFPEKPKNFGQFRLAERYYPDWFDADTGSPAFGIGVQYADFGSLSVFYLIAFSAFGAIMVNSFVNSEPNSANFLMLLFFCGLGAIPAGDYYYFPEHLVVAFLLSKLLMWRVRFPKIAEWLGLRIVRASE